MRIALVAPVNESCPPPGYGGIELVVTLLADGLTQLGQDVTLFASGDSRTSARLRFTERSALRKRCSGPQEALAAELIHVAAAFEAAGEFDVIHNHAGFPAIAMASLVATPTLTTLHGPFTASNGGFFKAMGDHPFVAISAAQRSSAPGGVNVLEVVHNGIPTADYRQPVFPGLAISPDEWKRNLLFLGRVSPEKGTHLAIEVARRCNLPLIIAGKVDEVDRDYWQTSVLPHVDGEAVRYIGEVGGTRKHELLAGSLALLHPIQWPEPFGLVMAEAMACGTPVVAIGLGSVPEVVQHGVTGFICEKVDDMVEAVNNLDALDPAIIREVCRVRFDASRMVTDYLALYQRLAEGRLTGRPRSRATVSPTFAQERSLP